MRDLYFLERLIRTHRYSGDVLIIPESVSDHVWCMISLALEFVPKINSSIRKYNSEGNNVKELDLKDVIYRISLHDIDESVSCDIPRPFKYYSIETRDKINETVNTILSSKISKDIFEDSINAKESEVPEGFFVKILDSVQAGYKMMSEIKLGNEYFEGEISNVIDYLVDISKSLGELPFDGFLKVQFIDFIRFQLKQFKIEPE